MAWELFRSGLSRIADVVGVALLALAVMLCLLGGSRDFETEALQLGFLGTATCWLSPGARRNLPWALVAFAAAGVLSAVAHRAGARGAVIDPAFHLVVMVVFIYGAAHQLRTPLRLSMLAIGMVAAVSILGVQIVFDRAHTNFAYERIGSTGIPSVAQWGSLHQTGMLFAVALPIPLAVAFVSRSVSISLAGLSMAAALLVIGLVNGSRTGVLAMALAAALVPVAVSGRRFQAAHRWFLRAVLVIVAGALVLAIFFNKTSMPVLRSPTGDRLPIWTAAAHIALDNPLLGAGPGNFTKAMVMDGYASAHLPWYPHNRGGVEQAHNLVLHTAAEIGVPGAMFLVALWWGMAAACWRAWRQGVYPLLALSYWAVLVTFFVRAQADNFLDNLVTTDRTRILVWTLMAAALAIQRLTTTAPERA